MRVVAFHSNSFDEYNEWARTEEKIFQRLVTLIRDTRRTPFEGIGKPEPLKGDFACCWSRRITDEHRLVYKVSNEAIIITLL